MTDFETSWKRHKELVAKANDLNKVIVFDALAAAGITDVGVDFDGEGDSGQIDAVSARVGDKPLDCPATTLSLHVAEWGQPELTLREMPLSEAIEDLCYGYLAQEHGGWQNNDGAYGEFIINVAARTIDLEFCGRFTDYITSRHSF